MTKKVENKSEATAEVAAAVTLDEFCSRLSVSDRRVEMIGAFHHAEKKAGRVKGAEADYAARFDAFVKQPA